MILPIGNQQANWSNRGIPLWVVDNKSCQAVCDVKEDEEEKGQAEAVRAHAAKRMSTGQEPAPKKKATASKPPATKAVMKRY